MCVRSSRTAHHPARRGLSCDKPASAGASATATAATAPSRRRTPPAPSAARTPPSCASLWRPPASDWAAGPQAVRLPKSRLSLRRCMCACACATKSN
eukprot:CAMPEP_0198699496 /NCGR_PEP_ID=MMETSP1468-20131203/354557_1 /TAXON_ID=1461545 /ORGANISM="Mantoniella sp, Strain CCMP1436" /LENGTH=96 /DNA_ID=CAMNT_0044457007 /DNA_START=386 /DNA_END=676 /DNA_ORIENTATION=-